MSKNELINQREILFDKIERFYKEDGKLTPVEQEICQRWELAFSLLQKHRSKSIAISKYIRILDKQGINISKNTAYSDFKKSEEIFTPITKVSKDLQRLIIIESIDKDITKLKLKQRKEDIPNSLYIQLQDQINKLYDLRIKAGGLHQDDPNIPDFSQLQMPNIQVNVSPKVESMLKRMMANGAIDTTELTKRFTEDAEITDFDETTD
jgi:hypothetical protein